ncbi:MAG: hypothetical protein ABI857_01530 [Acidobacteriota bacterium]
MSRNLKSYFSLVLVLCLTGAFVVSAFGQEAKPPKEPRVKVYPPVPGNEPPGFFDNDRITSEKAMAVDPNVAIKLCVSHGDLKINGWHRDEVRVFVKDGRKFRLKALEKSATGQVNWLWIGNVVEGRSSPSSECLAGESIEIDAPVGSNLDLSGRATRTSIDSVKKVKVKIVEGMITLRNISGGISAYTSQGDVIVENSGGAISVESTTGNIVAVEVTPGQIGDLLKVRTNGGSISLQRVEHRQIEASSISGSLLFDGKFLSGGIYNFRTSNGSIVLAIPATSSCTLNATYGFGTFKSDIPLKIVTENVTPLAKVVVAKIGDGDAAVSLETTRGSIEIRKQASYAKKP